MLIMRMLFLRGTGNTPCPRGRRRQQGSSWVESEPGDTVYIRAAEGHKGTGDGAHGWTVRLRDVASSRVPSERCTHLGACWVPAGCLQGACTPAGTRIRVPADLQAPDLQAPDFVSRFERSVRVPGCLLLC